MEELLTEIGVLPWYPVKKNESVRTYLSSKLSSERSHYLPNSISLYVDLGVADNDVSVFLRDMVNQIERDSNAIQGRKERFVDMELFSSSEMDDILTTKRDFQPWVIYYSENGGLRADIQYPGSLSSGVYPCFSMQNHGIFWEKVDTDDKGYELTLVTARRDGEEWDYDSDIGHESAHAAFAPIPLFVQAGYFGTEKEQSLEIERAKFIYNCLELSVVGIRGERRSTESGLPLETKKEVHDFLEYGSHKLPHAGFDSSLEEYTDNDAHVDAKDDDRIFTLTAPALRVVSGLTRKDINNTEPPTKERLTEIDMIFK